MATLQQKCAVTCSEATRAQDFAIQLNAFAEEFDHRLAAALPRAKQTDLADAMSYAVLGKAKRFRAFLVHTAFQFVNADREAAWTIGCAVELVHAASLVLDDMPSMDAAAVRRQKPALHHRYGEGLALVTAMSLVMGAFELLAGNLLDLSAKQKCALSGRLAACCGAAGMAAGQAIDLAGGVSSISQKTSPLTGFCWEAAGIVKGQSAGECAAMYAFGEHLGHLFQMRDDDLDSNGMVAERTDLFHEQSTEDLLLGLPVHAMGMERQHELRQLIDWIVERNR